MEHATESAAVRGFLDRTWRMIVEQDAEQKYSFQMPFTTINRNQRAGTTGRAAQDDQGRYRRLSSRSVLTPRSPVMMEFVNFLHQVKIGTTAEHAMEPFVLLLVAQLRLTSPRNCGRFWGMTESRWPMNHGPSTTRRRTVDAES